MKASQIIINSVICRQAARNIYPLDPDELFNEVWLKIRERELREPDWFPDIDPKRYFLRAMRNTKLNWIVREKNRKAYEGGYKSPDPAYGIEYERFMIQWINTPTDNEDIMFLKNILILALYCKDINDACETCEMSRASFWKYRKIAEKQLYNDFQAANIGNVFSTDLV